MKLVVSDLDGTLLNDDSEVSNETIQAIKRLKEISIKPPSILCTFSKPRLFKKLTASALLCPLLQYT